MSLLPNHDTHAVMQAHPYADTEEIETIDTGLAKQWKFSPLFKNPLAETDIRLTGSRIKDYKLAELNAGQTHIPGVTVWHHAWRKDRFGNYRMQLVSFSAHQKTCPHAGGCKLWTIEHHKIYKAQGPVHVSEALSAKTIAGKKIYRTGTIRNGVNSSSYSDYFIDYIFEEENPLHIETKICKGSFHKREPLASRIWGLDPYGNLFLSNDNGQLFFYDHETRKLFFLAIDEGKILK